MSIWDTLGIGGGDDNVNIGLSPSEQQAGGYTRQTDMFGGPAYGYNGGWYNGDKLDPTKSASEMDVARYRDMGGQQTAAPFIDRTQTNESRGMLMGSLSPLQAGAEGWSPDQHALAMGAAGDTRDLRQLGDASAGNTEDMGLLRTAAEGNAPSRAEILGQAMSDRALRSQVSAAGSVRGGPGASAAAYRYASQNAMQNRADMNAGIQAARADELAQARGAYSGAMGAARRDYGTLSGQARRDYGTLAGQARRDYNIGASGAYGQDSDLAYKQALLQEQQNQENAQNQRYYEGLASQTRQFDQQARAGAMGAQTAQTNWQRTNQNAEKAADWQKTKDTVGLVGAVGSGATSGYANMAAADYYNNNQPSDVTSKEPVTYGSLAPITWGTAESDSKSKAKHSLGQRTDPYPDSIDPSFYNSIPLRDTVGTYAGGIYRSNPYGEGPNDTPGLTSDPSAKRAAFAAGMNYAQENVDKGEAGPVPAEYAPKKPGERETKTFQRQDAGKAGEALRHEEASRQDLKKADQSAARLNPVATGAYAASSLGHGYAAQDQWNQSLGPVQNMSTPALPAPPANATPYASFSRADSYRSPEDYQQLSDPETKAAVKDAGGSVYYDPKGEPYARFGDIDIAIQEKPREAHFQRNERDSSGRMPQAVADLGRYYSDTAKQADREIAGMQANLRKGPAVARYEGEVDEAAPGWLSDYMRTQENGEKSLEKRFGTIPEQNMADAARSMEPFPYRYKAQYAPPDQAPGEVNIGPMANQMARDPVASTAIVRDPGTGKLAIDQGKGLKLVMGSLGAMQQQIDALRARSAARRRGDTAQP